MAVKRIHGLYVIMDTQTLAGRPFAEVLQQVLAGGARIVQYRDKGSDTAQRRLQAAQVVDQCRRHGAVSIINDDAGLAVETGADGVHVGREDDAVARVRAVYPELIVGASCYASLDRAREQAAQGAAYLAFGSFFPSPTKPDAVRAAPALLAAAKTQFDLPLVAIGGIMADNARVLIESGADAVAVISAILRAENPCQASRQISSLFDT